jgi:ferredoxin-NADP reductase
MQAIDSFLNRFTMYRFLVYYLSALLGLGFILSVFHAMPVQPDAVLSTTGIYLIVTSLTNWIFAKALKVEVNFESTVITALILALISGPVSVLADPGKAAVLALAGIVAIASKYLVAINKQHVFNPAAFGVFVSGALFGLYSTWWIGNVAMLPLVVVGGLLLIRKISRFRLVGVFFGFYVLFLIAMSIGQGLGAAGALKNIVYVTLHTEIIFFAAVMLIEPITAPKRFSMQVIFAALVAFFLQPQLTLFGQNFTPEEALLLGNLFSYAVSPSFKLALRLKERREIGNGILAFAFEYPQGFSHRLGQYMEWTLPLGELDERGNRRYFSIASSPTESELLIAARFYPKSSRYKQVMAAMEAGDQIVAAELSGDFVLPRDPKVPLVFIAGGIGITPFRSMLKYLTDSGEKRDIVLIYSSSRADQIVFRDVFAEAGRAIGLKTVYTLTDQSHLPADWDGEKGYIDEAMIRRSVPDFDKRTYFISGSPEMVETVKKSLRAAGVRRWKIRSDYFPGY